MRWVVPVIPVLRLWKLVPPMRVVVLVVPLLHDWNFVFPTRVLVPWRADWACETCPKRAIAAREARVVMRFIFCSRIEAA
jgi:hypothetical protein